jgi:hypothetical protein
MTHPLDPRAGALMPRFCRGCGCDDNHACMTPDGPCSWALHDIDTPTGVCSGCAAELDYDMQLLAGVGRDRDGEPLVLKRSALIRAVG